MPNAVLQKNKNNSAWKSMFEGAAERPHLRIGESQYATPRAVIAKWVKGRGGKFAQIQKDTKMTLCDFDLCKDLL